MSAPPYEPTGFQMIQDIEIRNYRCYSHLRLSGCQRLNVLIGDSGSGKTTLLEAIFLALAVTPEVAVRFRQTRGLGGMFHGTSRQIEEALFGGLFHRWDTTKAISIALGGSGPEARSVLIARGGGDVTIPFDSEGGDSFNGGYGISFTWIDAGGARRTLHPQISTESIKMPNSEEDQPDFFFFGTGSSFASEETAARFSTLSRTGRAQSFVNTLTEEYPWIENLAIEVIAGAPAVHASVKGLPEKIPLNDVSSAINKLVTLTATIASRPHSVVLVDEIENGVYYKHHGAMWKNLLRFTREYDSQMFVSTHSSECLTALVEAAGDNNSDIAFWRVERGQDGGPIIRQFAADQIKASLEYGGEVR